MAFLLTAATAMINDKSEFFDTLIFAWLFG